MIGDKPATKSQCEKLFRKRIMRPFYKIYCKRFLKFIGKCKTCRPEPEEDSGSQISQTDFFWNFDTGNNEKQYFGKFELGFIQNTVDPIVTIDWLTWTWIGAIKQPPLYPVIGVDGADGVGSLTEVDGKFTWELPGYLGGPGWEDDTVGTSPTVDIKNHYYAFQITFASGFTETVFFYFHIQGMGEEPSNINQVLLLSDDPNWINVDGREGQMKLFDHD